MEVKEPNQWAQTLVAAIMAVGVSATAMEVVAAESKPSMEKCYGITKKGMNECAANNHACQGESKKDNDPTEWIYVPTGTCDKIVGGIKK
jgi:uncharacterized membrane protein